MDLSPEVVAEPFLALLSLPDLILGLGAGVDLARFHRGWDGFQGNRC